MGQQDPPCKMRNRVPGSTSQAEEVVGVHPSQDKGKVMRKEAGTLCTEGFLSGSPMRLQVSYSIFTWEGTTA